MEDAGRHPPTVLARARRWRTIDAGFLVAYLVLPVVAFVRVRNLTWLAIHLAVAVSLAGVVIGFVRDRGHLWTMVELQWVLLAALVIVALLAWLRPAPDPRPLRRQLVTVLVPMAFVIVVVFVVTTFLTERPAFYNPLSYLIGHSVAEDNAKWLDFASQLASGNPIEQAVALGGPLQLVIVFVATALSVVSSLLLGGVNQVAVAANSVVFAEFLMVALVPLALAPIAEMLLARSRAPDPRPQGWVPWPLVVLASVVVVSASLLVTGFGHLSLQFTFLIMVLWSATFLANPRVARARLLTTLVVAAGMTVWLPLNVLAAVLLGGWLVILVARPLRRGAGALDIVGSALWFVFAVCLWGPITSSLAYFLGTATAGGPVDVTRLVSGAGGAVSASVGAVVHAPGWIARLINLDENSLFSSAGGTEQAGPILAGLAIVSSVLAVVVLSRLRSATDRSTYVRFAPVGLLAAFALALTMLDLWTTGDGPHYGSLKFMFMTVIVLLGTTLPFALLALDPDRLGMSPARWAGVGGVLILLVVDTMLPRAAAAIRPGQWSPPIPFDNPASYWWPADVKDSAVQTIASNPVACVYLPQGAKVPSALTDSPASDAQRVYSCTRIIAGLAGSDTTAQPLVDWLRREWLTNTPAWSDVYDGLVAMPDSVQDKPVILLDEASNVVGLESVRSLLTRFPKFAGRTAEELAIINSERAATAP